MSRGDQPLKSEHYRELYTPVYATRGKPQPPPTAGAFDLPLVGCCINAEWMSHILGSTAILEWADMWEGTAEEKQFALDQILKIQDAMTCRCGGTTTSIIRNTITQSYRFQLQIEFALNGLAGVAPDAPDTFFDEDSGDDFGEAERRKIALCWACHDYIDTILQEAIETARDIGLEIFGAGISASFQLGPIAGLAFTSAAISLTGTVIAAFSNTEIRNDIACCMLDGLTGIAITQANFEASLSACGFTVPSLKDTIRELVEETLNDTFNFFSFIRVLGAYHGVTDLLSQCPCDAMFETCDFTIDECGWETQTGGPGNLATYDEGLGWDNGPGGTVNHRIVIKRLLDVDTAFSQCKIFTVNTLGASDILYRVKLFDIDDNVLLDDSVIVTSDETSHLFTFAEVAGVRTIQVNIAKQGLETDFPGHLTAVQVVADPPPFPGQ